MTDTDRDTDLAARIGALLRDVPDFPKPGILFKDITPLLADGPAFDAVIHALAASARGEVDGDIDLVGGIEARGFLVAGALARQLGCGVLPIRKAGKLPPPVRSVRYDLEYGSAEIEIPTVGAEGAGLLTGRRVLLVDDVLATGGTLRAATGLVSGAGATVVAAAVIVELADLGGRAALGDTVPLDALLTV